MRPLSVSMTLMALLVSLCEAKAASLSIAPTSLNLTAPASAATITLRNHGDRAVHVQVRPFAWHQRNGKDVLEPTRDLVASPPITTVAPGIEYVVRIVRLAKHSVVGEESYRLLIDELPSPERRRNGTVTVLLRYSVPIFVKSPDARHADVAWRIDDQGQDAVLTAFNAGESHLRISNLRIRSSQGTRTSIAAGLAGYVLGGAAREWILSRQAAALIGKDTQLSADSEAGAFDATIEVGTTR